MRYGATHAASIINMRKIGSKYKDFGGVWQRVNTEIKNTNRSKIKYKIKLIGRYRFSRIIYLKHCIYGTQISLISAS